MSYFDKEFFSRQENVESWLAGKPREIAVAFAARAALRSAPVLIAAFDRLGNVTKVGHTIFLPTFRALAVAWVNGRYPGHQADVRTGAAISAANAAADAADAYTIGGAARVARAAAYAARAANDATRASVTYSTIAHAGEAVFHASYAIKAEFSGQPKFDSRLSDVTNALAADAEKIRLAQNHTHASTVAEELAAQPLWLRGTPAWASGLWDQVEHVLQTDSTDWTVWKTWYRARIDGKSWNAALELDRASTPNDVWENGPDAVNAYLGRLAEIYEKPFDAPVPLVPPQRPAALEPNWIDGRLTLQNTRTDADINEANLEALLSGLRADLREFADDVANEANIDKRFPSFVRRLCDRIPSTRPLQQDLFRLGHVEEVFLEYTKTVVGEWPDFLAARYHALSLQFDRTMRQFPAWREFKRNAARQRFTEQQFKIASPLAAAAAVALHEENFRDNVDPLVAYNLLKLAEPLHADENSSEGDRLDEALSLATQDLAFDVVESVNNILKRIAEVALAAARSAASTVDNVGQQYRKEFEAGLVEEAGKTGRKHGRNAIKWLSGTIFVGGTSYALAQLIDAYPTIFGWLPGVIKFLSTHWPL